MQLIHHLGIQELDSAGLALALQRLAEIQHRTIPAGVGFTGRWEDGRLQSVAGIRAKLQAAREAGIFVLFACASQHDVEELRQQGPEPGVTLILLQAGSSLDDIIVRVNTVCHDLGLTEYRWSHVIDGWRNDVRGRPHPRAKSQLLPDASKENCPVGFIGRERLLRELDERKKEIETQGGSGHLALVGSPRSGKTTLLSHWIFRPGSTWPRKPIWYSFQRERRDTRSWKNLEESLIDQINARFCVLFGTSVSQEILKAKHPPFPEFLEAMNDSSQSRIDLVIDGLDEAFSDDRVDIADFLISFKPRGLRVVATQQAPAFRAFTNRIEIGGHTPENDADAMELLTKFKRGSRGSMTSVGEVGSSVRPRGIFGFSPTSCAGRGREARRWPESPDELPLTDDVNTYCKLIIEEIQASVKRGSGDSATSDREWEKLGKFLITLAALDPISWQIRDVLILAGLPAKGRKTSSHEETY